MSVCARVLILLVAGLLGTALSAHAREGKLGFTVDLAADEAGPSPASRKSS